MRGGVPRQRSSNMPPPRLLPRPPKATDPDDQIQRKGSSSGSNHNGVNVKVILRCRPLAHYEAGRANVDSIVECRESNREVIVKHAKRGENSDKTYLFDGVCGPTTTQADLFNSYIVPLVDEVLQGFNCTIFAYGQTGTGKTYTMEGLWPRDLTSEPATPIHSSETSGREIAFRLPWEVGVIPRSIALIFERLTNSSMEFSVKVSYLEIYNEELHDLLQDGDRIPLRLFDRDQAERHGVTTKGLAVDKLEEVTVRELPAVKKLLTTAAKRRRTAETTLNRQSSRSHCIFTVIITMKEVNLDGEDIIRIGKLNLVDLAGSENIQRSGTSHIKDRTKEAGMINQSLLTLGRCINALVEHSSYIPYRDSKLTRLLSDSLGGRTKTCIIATVSPSPISCDETLSTLDYAHRAKHIRNRPEVNQRMTQKFVVRELTAEIERLKQELAWARNQAGCVAIPQDQWDQVSVQIEESFRDLQSLRDSLASTTGSLLELRDSNTDLLQQLSDQETLNRHLNHKLEEANADLEGLRDVLEQSIRLSTEGSLCTGLRTLEAFEIAGAMEKNVESNSMYIEAIEALAQHTHTSMKEHDETWTECRETLLNSVAGDLLKQIEGANQQGTELRARLCTSVLNNVMAFVDKGRLMLQTNESELESRSKQLKDRLHFLCVVSWKDYLKEVDLAAKSFTEKEDEKWREFLLTAVESILVKEVDSLKSAMRTTLQSLCGIFMNSINGLMNDAEGFNATCQTHLQHDSLRKDDLIRSLRNEVRTMRRDTTAAAEHLSALESRSNEEHTRMAKQIEFLTAELVGKLKETVENFGLKRRNEWATIEKAKENILLSAQATEGRMEERLTEFTRDDKKAAETFHSNVKDCETRLTQGLEVVKMNATAQSQSSDAHLAELERIQAALRDTIKGRQTESAQSFLNFDTRRQEIAAQGGTRMTKAFSEVNDALERHRRLSRDLVESAGVTAPEELLNTLRTVLGEGMTEDEATGIKVRENLECITDRISKCAKAMEEVVERHDNEESKRILEDALYDLTKAARPPLDKLTPTDLTTYRTILKDIELVELLVEGDRVPTEEQIREYAGVHIKETHFQVLKQLIGLLDEGLCSQTRRGTPGTVEWAPKFVLECVARARGQETERGVLRLTPRSQTHGRRLYDGWVAVEEIKRLANGPAGASRQMSEAVARVRASENYNAGTGDMPELPSTPAPLVTATREAYRGPAPSKRPAIVPPLKLPKRSQIPNSPMLPEARRAQLSSQSEVSGPNKENSPRCHSEIGGPLSGTSSGVDQLDSVKTESHQRQGPRHRKIHSQTTAARASRPFAKSSKQGSIPQNRRFASQADA